jgi:hypothetical protein
MSPTFSLIDVPEKFLDQKKWARVRAFASSNLEALSYLNAPYPDGAADFFWSARGSDADARRCYRLGKSLVSECRSLFIAGELVASGHTRDGVKELIPPALWIDLYPMFVTEKIVGRTRQLRWLLPFHSRTSTQQGWAATLELFTKGLVGYSNRQVRHRTLLLHLNAESRLRCMTDCTVSLFFGMMIIWQ